MKLVLAICMLLGIVGQFCQVQAVICHEDKIACLKTDFTIETCDKTSKTCKCVAGYAPTLEGCIKKPEKPTVDLDGIHNDEALEGKDIILTCKGEAASEYKWYKDGAVDVNQKLSKATFKMGKANIKIQCALVSRVESDISDNMIIKYLAAASTTTPTASTATPKIIFNADKVADTKEYTAQCTGYPWGFDPTGIKFTNKAGVVSTPKQTQKTTREEYTCKFELAGFKFTVTSAMENGPEVYDKIDNVFITYKGMPMADTYAYKEVDAPNLKCQTFPEPAFLKTAVTYKWKGQTATGEEWQVPKSKRDYEGLTCTATLGKTNTESASVDIIVKNDYLAKPTVKASPTMPVVESQVSFTCHTTAKDVMVSWKHKSKTLIGQTDRTIQFGNLSTSLNGDVTCSIHKHGFSSESDAYSLDVKSDLAKPTVEAEGKTEIVRNGGFKLICKSESAVPFMKYSWQKACNTINGAVSSVYTKDNAQDGDAANYTCTTTFDSLTATSDEFGVKVVEPGKKCTTDSDCDGALKELSGKCDLAKGRCICADGYSATGDKCDGVAQLAASILLVLVAAIFTRLM